MSLGAVVVTVISVWLAAAMQAATGMGFALVLSPVLLAVMPAGEALMVLLLLEDVVNLLILFAEHKPRQVRMGDVSGLLVAALPGLVAGVVLLRTVPQPALELAVGAGVIALAVLSLRGVLSRRRGHGSHHDGWGRALAGLAAGCLTTSTGLNGPPLALWFAGSEATAGEVRDSLQVIFLGLSLPGLGAIMVFTHALSELPSAWLLVGLLPVLAAGHWTGGRWFARLDADRYATALTTVLVAAGIASIVSGAVSV